MCVCVCVCVCVSTLVQVVCVYSGDTRFPVVHYVLCIPCILYVLYVLHVYFYTCMYTYLLPPPGILLHYDTPALSHLYFVNPQWLCDMLAHVITVPEVNGWIGAQSGTYSQYEHYVQ